MNHRITEVLTWVMILVPFIFIALFWNQFPDKIPTHWNIKGEPDSYGSKTWGLFILPLTNLFIYGLFRVIPRIDPKKANHALFSGKRKAMQLMLHTFMTVIFFLTALASLGFEFNIGRIVILGVILLMMGIGNYMSNIRQNYFIGVRTPWTLENEDVWRETHRFTAKLWVAASLVALVGFISNLFPDWTLIIYIVIISVIPIAYSYLIFKKNKQTSTS